MSNPDDHVDKALGTMFSADDAEAPDREARRRAIAMARNEFEQAQEEKATKANERPQGLIAWLRLIVTGNDDNGRSIMPFSKGFAYSGVGAVAVGVDDRELEDDLQGEPARDAAAPLHPELERRRWGRPAGPAPAS